MPFYIAKGRLLHLKRAPFTTQKGIFCNAKDHLLKSNWEITLQETPSIPFSHNIITALVF